MKQGLLVTVGGAAIVVAGLAGCSSGDKSSSSSASSSSSSAASGSSSGPTAASGSGTAKVTIDGQEQNITGSIVCATVADTVSINIGQGSTGLSAALSTGDSPTVKAVALGSVGGSALAFTPGVPGGEASATKDGNTYKITGKATSMDMSNPMAMATKPFDMEITCP